MGIAKIVDERIYLVPWSLWPRHLKSLIIKEIHFGMRLLGSHLSKLNEFFVILLLTHEPC